MWTDARRRLAATAIAAAVSGALALTSCSDGHQESPTTILFGPTISAGSVSSECEPILAAFRGSPAAVASTASGDVQRGNAIRGFAGLAAGSAIIRGNDPSTPTGVVIDGTPNGMAYVIIDVAEASDDARVVGCASDGQYLAGHLPRSLATSPLYRALSGRSYLLFVPLLAAGEPFYGRSVAVAPVDASAGRLGVISPYFLTLSRSSVRASIPAGTCTAAIPCPTTHVVVVDLGDGASTSAETVLSTMATPPWPVTATLPAQAPDTVRIAVEFGPAGALGAYARFSLT